MPQHSRGFFTIAQDGPSGGYVRMAYAMAMSLRLTQKSVPGLSIGITPDTSVPDEYRWAFDEVIEIPWGDHASNSEWKLENEWKVIHMSPYDETIKLDSDMLFFSDIGRWWDEMALEDFVACNRVLDYRAGTVRNDHYRKVFSVNGLPNIYTAMMYFKKTDATHELFELVKFIYFNWQAMFENFLIPEHRPTQVSTDVVFALAMKILDLDGSSRTERMIPTFTHMKTKLQGWKGGIDDDWMRHMESFVTPELEFKIGNYIQHFPLHYYRKEFLTDEIIGYYERQLGRR